MLNTTENLLKAIELGEDTYLELKDLRFDGNQVGEPHRNSMADELAAMANSLNQAIRSNFDEQAVTFASRDCLSKSLWEKFRTPLSPKDDEEFLLKLKLLTRDEESNITPSVSGILLATKAPQEFLPNAYIQCVAYNGTERKSNPMYQIDAKDIFGPLDEQIISAYKFVKSNTKIRAFKNPGRVDVPQYAPQAVFEAIVNAVAHRDYSIQSSKIRIHMFSDRLEIFSPGTIPNTMTIESLALRQASRNELIASLLARCAVVDFEEIAGYRSFLMDKRGEGVPIILSESQKLSGRLPEYQLIDDSELKLTLFAEGGG
ncbi:MAG: hypothetical protein FWH22_06470 [Fibromonadales bacterium]|nr:hypothetical protein [Fibromonadales bacterium]